eukprot:75003-Pleurochrysis_carterae.AAC.1
MRGDLTSVRRCPMFPSVSSRSSLRVPGHSKERAGAGEGGREGDTRVEIEGMGWAETRSKE